jgi:hypothetical protein
MAKKGQGLPLSFIVIAAISALILVLVIAFTIGGLGGFFKQINIAGSDEISVVRSTCSSACTSAQQLSSTVDQFAQSDYCRKTFTVDLDKNGKITTSKETPKGPVETGLRCYDASAYAQTARTSAFTPIVSSINIDCPVTFGNDIYSTGAKACAKTIG